MIRISLCSLRARLAFIVLITVLPALGLVVYTALEARRLAAARAHGETVRMVGMASGNQQRLIEASHQLLVTLAKLPEVRADDSEACSALLAALLKEHRAYANIGAIKPDGQVFCSALPAARTINVSDRTYFKTVMKSKNFAIGEYQIGRFTGRANLVTAYPVLDESGSVKVIVYAALNLDWMNHLLSESRSVPGARLTVMDRNGIVLARYPDPGQWVGSKVVDTAIAQTVLAKEEGTAEGVGLEGTERLYAFSRLQGIPRDSQIAVWASIPKDVVFADSNRAFTRNLIALLLVTFLVAVLAWVGSNWSILRPVQALITTTERFGAGDLTARAELQSGKGELGQLAGTFNQMASSLERRYKELQALRDIDLSILSALDLRTVLDVLVEKIDIHLPYSAATVRIYNKETKRLELAASRHIEIAGAGRNEQDASSTLPQLVFEHEGPISILDISREQTGDRDFLLGQGFVSYFGAPLVSKEGPLGVLSFYTKEEHRFTREEIEFLTALSGQASIAISNSILYERTKQQALDLDKSNKIKDEFLGVISHELRTPLNVITGYTDLVKDGALGEINSKQTTALQRIVSCTADLLEMVNGILYVTSLEAKAVKAHWQDVHIGEFLNQLRSNYDSSLSKDIVVNWDYPSELPTVQTDALKLKHILHNLIGNAIKFTEHGAVTISARHHPQTQTVEFKVADTGIGIPKSLHRAIFEKFRQADGSRTRSYAGVGLGLYIVKQFTELIGGRVDVQSDSGKGATFTISIPSEDLNKSRDIKAGTFPIHIDAV